MVKKQKYYRKSKKGKLPKHFKANVKKALLSISENKYHDYATAINSATTTVGMADALVIAQGTTDLTRIGDAIILKSVHLKYTLVAGQTQANTNNVRIMIFQWFDNTSPAAADILASTAANSAVVSDYYMDTSRKDVTFKVLYDKTHSVSPITAGPSSIIPVDKYLKGFRRNVMFNGGGTSPSYGDIYFLNVSDQAPGAAGTVPLYNISLRTQFIDP